MTNKMKLIWLTLITLSLPLLFTAANSTAQESLATDELIQAQSALRKSTIAPNATQA